MFYHHGNFNYQMLPFIRYISKMSLLNIAKSLRRSVCIVTLKKIHLIIDVTTTCGTFGAVFCVHHQPRHVRHHFSPDDLLRLRLSDARRSRESYRLKRYRLLAHARRSSCWFFDRLLSICIPAGNSLRK